MRGWAAEIRRLPLGYATLGALSGWFVSGAILVWHAKVPAFDEIERKAVTGEVTDLRVFEPMKESPVLDFGLSGEASRFRVQNGVFVAALHRSVPAGLKDGSAVSLLVGAGDYANPFSPAPLRVPTVTVDAMALGGTPVLTLEQSRAWAADNRRIAKVLFVIFVPLTLLITAAALLRFAVGR
jgi:hypothetical protein